MEVDVELKPCPFCGGDARMRVSKDHEGSGGFYALGLFVDHDEKCFIGRKTSFFNCGFIEFDFRSHPDLVEYIASGPAERWNRRATNE